MFAEEDYLPLYEYQCLKCGALVEKIQKFSDPALTECEKCGGQLERLLSAPAIQFKGSGWYITDYARKSGGSTSDSTGQSSAAGDKAPKTSDSETKKSDSESKKKIEEASKPK